MEELLGGGHCSVVRGLRGVSVHYSGGAVPRPVHFDPETKFNEEQIRAEVILVFEGEILLDTIFLHRHTYTQRPDH